MKVQQAVGEYLWATWTRLNKAETLSHSVSFAPLFISVNFQIKLDFLILPTLNVEYCTVFRWNSYTSFCKLFLWNSFEKHFYEHCLFAADIARSLIAGMFISMTQNQSTWNCGNNIKLWNINDIVSYLQCLCVRVCACDMKFKICFYFYGFRKWAHYSD